MSNWFLYTCESQIWYNNFMDEKKRILKVLEKIETELKEEFKPKIEHPHQTNPIYKKLINFKNAKIGDKWSIKDLLR